MAWLTNWTYRKEITVTNSSADYQTKVLVGESSGATGEEVDCGGHVAADFDDLRFTAADGSTLLDYWIESITGTTPNGLATVWVENNATPDTTLYMYYGGTETAVSSGADTFIQYHATASATFLDAAVSPTTGGLRVRLRAKAAASTNTMYGIANAASMADDSVAIQFYDAGSLRYVYAGNEGTTTAESEASHLADGNYYTVYGLLLFGTSLKGYVEDAGGQIGGDISTNLPDEAMGLFMWEVSGTSDQLWSFISKYAATEPSFAFGAETTEGWANISHVKNIAAASISHKKGIAVASISHVKGVAV